MLRIAHRFAVLAAVLGLVAGCSKPEAKKIQLSGKVTFNGKLVPAGYISFIPDASKGNKGEARVVQIKDGVYDSSTEQYPGLYPGPTDVLIAGFDGKPLHLYPQGKQIFNAYKLHETLEDGTKNFDVPASAAQNLKVFPTADPN